MEENPTKGDQARSGRTIPAEPAFPGRRSFFSVLVGLGTVGVSALLSVPLVRFALYPLLAKTTETIWSYLGGVDEFSSLRLPVRRIISIEQRDGWRKAVSEKTLYVTKGDDGRLRVFSAICPHLGCSIAWSEMKSQFICPCHAGVFASDGARISGPPPRGMDEVATAIKDGRVMVRYQYFRQLVPTKEVIG